MFWIIGILFVYFFSTLFVVYSLMSQVNRRKALLLENLLILQDNLGEKKTILSELADLNLGCVSPEVCEGIRAEIATEEETVRAEKGKITIAQAELESVDTRLRELEEIERELENSGVEAARELELLRAQEREIEVRNQKLREQLDSCVMQLEKLIHDFSSSAEATQRLNNAKSELMQTQKKIQFYSDNVQQLNKKYMDLKRAYDALDIEYAQLYEKQSRG